MVYVLEHGVDYEGYRAVGVFQTLEAARTAAVKYQREYSGIIDYLQISGFNMNEEPTNTPYREYL